MDNEFLAAQDEWNAVASIVVSKGNVPVQQYNQGDEIKTITALISTAECTEYFKNHINLAAHKKNIKPVLHYTKIRICLNIFFGPPKLLPALKDDRDLVFAMAAWPLENDDTVHMQMLNTVYKQLTNSKLDPPRYGQHWDDIGFQGTDPATDLRGGGCLGLANMVYITTTAKYRDAVQDIYSLSRHSVQNFPFGVMSLNITRIALHALRAQLLNKPANKARDIIGVFNDFYVSTFFHLALMWRLGHKTIQDSGHVLQEVEAYCTRNVTAVLKRLAEDYTDVKVHSPPSEHIAEFTDLERL